MKKAFFFIAFLFATANSFSQVSVSGYYTSKGTYVQPHQRTAPNSTRNDNYSTIGNVNPYTGTAGTKLGDGYYGSSSYSTPVYNSTPVYSTPSSYPTSTYSTPVYTGSRGGQYYINGNGNKTYISR